MHIVSGYIGGFTFTCFEGDGASQAIQREHGPEDILSGKSLICTTQKRSQTRCHSE